MNIHQRQLPWFNVFDPTIMGGVFLLSLLPTLLAGWGIYVGVRVRNDGVPATATLTFAGCTVPGARSCTSTYHVNYVFSPPDSQDRLGPYWIHRMVRATVPEEVYDRASRSGEVPIRYVPGQPRWNLPLECSTTNSLVIVWLFCVILNIVCLGAVAMAIYFRRTRQLLLARQRESHFTEWSP